MKWFSSLFAKRAETNVQPSGGDARGLNALTGGSTLESAIVATPGFNEHTWVENEFCCPACRAKGSKTTTGHAMIVRKLMEDRLQVLQLSNVVCACAASSTFWCDVTSVTSENFLTYARECQPGSALRFVSGRGALPAEALALAEAPPGFATLAGPIHVGLGFSGAAEWAAGEGLAAFKRGDNEVAVQMLQIAVRLKEDSAQAWNVLGGALYKVGRIEEAAAAVRRFLELEAPTSPRIESARRFLSTLQAATGTPQTGDVDEPRGEARDATMEEGMVSGFDEEQAQRLLEDGRIEEGLKLAEDALKTEPSQPGPHGVKANALMFLGRDQEALEILEKALAQWPDHAQLRLRMGLVCNKLGRYDEARAHFQGLLQSGAGDLKNRVEVALADSFVYSRKYAEALNAYDGALADNPQFGLAWINRGLALYNLGRYKEALDSIDRGEAIWPNHPTVGMLRRAIVSRM